jgi:hypothetical protein
MRNRGLKKVGNKVKESTVEKVEQRIENKAVKL